MTPKQLSDIASTGFLNEYMQFNSQQETPLIYDLWCGLWLLSLAVGRQCTVARPRAPVFMNIFCLLIAESGLTRKSTALSIATQLAKEITGEHTTWIETATRTTTFINRLAWSTVNYDCANVAISISELARFLGRSGQVKDMPGILTDLYDCPNEQRFLDTSVRDVYITFIGATTPSSLVSSVNPAIVEFGFASRFYPIIGTERKRLNAWPEFALNELEQRLELISSLKRIQQDVQSVEEVTVDVNALEEFKKWYTSRSVSNDAYQSSFEAREDHHVLKIAGLLAVNKGTWIITRDELSAAIALISDVKRNGNILFNTGFENDKLQQGINKVLTLLKRRTQPTLVTTLHGYLLSSMTRTQAKLLIDLLHEMEYVQLFQPASFHKRGKVPMYALATQKLKDELDMIKLVDQLVIDL